MELGTSLSFNRINQILHGGFKKDTFPTLTCMAPSNSSVNSLEHYWPHDAVYGIIYRFDGTEIINYFKNNKELQFWYKLQEMYHHNKNQNTEIISLYMWDSGPTEIDDIMPHFYRVN